MGETGTYVYGVCRALAPEWLRPVRGVGRAQVRSLEHCDLAAVVSDVDLDEFGSEGLQRNLEDLDWLADVAWVHDRVVKTVATHATIAPLRMAVVCLDDDSVRAKLDESHDRVDAALSRIEHRVEWGVKAYLDDENAKRTRESPAESGAAYLRRRRSELESRKTAEKSAAAAELEDLLHSTLSAETVASRRYPPSTNS